MDMLGKKEDGRRAHFLVVVGFAFFSGAWAIVSVLFADAMFVNEGIDEVQD